MTNRGRHFSARGQSSDYTFSVAKGAHRSSPDDILNRTWSAVCYSAARQIGVGDPPAEKAVVFTYTLGTALLYGGGGSDCNGRDRIGHCEGISSRG